MSSREFGAVTISLHRRRLSGRWAAMTGPARMPDAVWSHRLRAAHVPCLADHLPTVRRSLPWRILGVQLLLLGPVSGDGLRSVDLPREPARYRSMPSLGERQVVSHGISRPVARSTLADANESHDWRIYADFAQVLIGIARPLYAADPIGVDLDQSLYALDSTTIDLCLSLFPWAKFRRTKAPSRCTRCWTCTAISPRLSALPTAKCMTSTSSTRSLPEAGAFYVMDRGYVDFERLYVFTLSAAFFVVRTKSNVCAPAPLLASGGQDHRRSIRSHRHSDRHRLRQSLSGPVASRELSRSSKPGSGSSSSPTTSRFRHLLSLRSTSRAGRWNCSSSGSSNTCGSRPSTAPARTR